jgi:hypothetical protein
VFAGFSLQRTHGPSVQVKTCGNPQDRTSASESRCDLAAIFGFWGEYRRLGGEEGARQALLQSDG